MRIRSVLLGAALLPVLVVAGCSSGDKGGEAAPGSKTPATTAPDSGGEPSVSTEDNERIQCSTLVPEYLTEADGVIAKVEAGEDPAATAIEAQVPWAVLTSLPEDTPQSITQYITPMAEVMRQIKDREGADVDAYHQASVSLRQLCGL